MASSEIINYIKKQKSFNTPDDIIKVKLASVGWIQEDIINAFSEIEREDRVFSNDFILEDRKSIPNDSKYKNDPYHEPIGSGSPEAQVFIKTKNENNQPEIERNWSAPKVETGNNQKFRQGQKFSPVYNSDLIKNSENQDVTPVVAKAEHTFSGTSFVPKKDTSIEVPIKKEEIFSVPKSPNIPIKNISTSGTSISPFKVMPGSVEELSKLGLPDLNYKNVTQPNSSGGKKHILGWIIFMIVFLLALVGATIFAGVKGYVDLPFSFIDSLKGEKIIQKEEEVFVPKIEETQNTNTVDVTTENIGEQKILKTEDSLFTDLDMENKKEDSSDLNQDEPLINNEVDNTSKNTQ